MVVDRKWRVARAYVCAVALRPNGCGDEAMTVPMERMARHSNDRGIVATRDHLQRFWPYFAIAGIVAILLGASFFIVETLPPRKVVMATGAEGGAYHELGIRYREILAQAGVELQLLPTTGALDNLTRLRDPRSGVSVGFIQGGTTTTKESP